MQQAEWRQVPQGSMSTGAKENESSTRCIWVTGFHHVIAHWRFETYKPFISLIFQLLSGHSEQQITKTTDSESADMGAHLYNNLCPAEWEEVRKENTHHMSGGGRAL
jgi:hypothetical protein